MKTQGLNKNNTIEMIEQLKKQIDFNNRLNKSARKYRAEHQDGLKKFNAYNDSPTSEMFAFVRSVVETEDWMSDILKRAYIRDAGAIVGGIYSVAVNTYILKDLHDCERHLKLLEKSETQASEEADGFRIERDLTENRLNLIFEDIPDEDMRHRLKYHGFKWSPKRQCWTRQLTNNAEYSLKQVLKEMKTK